MIFLNVVQDTVAAGFKYDTFICSECHDIVRRLVSTKHGQETATSQCRCIRHRLLRQLQRSRMSLLPL